mmetsp:Transcript_16137/g.40696  ORF Transcript_16137/g.40696 Transcript_16137/m.40696 type:complete len:348 (+) Transcript_16137:3-1046(+)
MMSEQEKAQRDKFVHDSKKADFADQRKGERQQYFADDNMSVDEMVRREKLSTRWDYEENMAQAGAASKRKAPEKAFDAEEDEYGANLGNTLKKMESKDKKMKTADLEERAKRIAVQEHQKSEAATTRDPFNLDNPKFPKHMLVAVGTRAYLMLQTRGRVCDGHCLIVPIALCPSTTNCDEDTLEEMRNFKKCLMQMFHTMDQDCIFHETATGFNRHPHIVVECVPVSRKTAANAPMYFKKALAECENEWEAQNKSIIDTRGVRKLSSKIPKNMPYFSVEFGLQGGFAHVIENEGAWSKHFGIDIMAGLLRKDAEILKRERSDIAHERRLCEMFKAGFEQFDWTKALQ